jgi:hypothetical protein
MGTRHCWVAQCFACRKGHDATRRSDALGYPAGFNFLDESRGSTVCGTRHKSKRPDEVRKVLVCRCGRTIFLADKVQHRAELLWVFRFHEVDRVAFSVDANCRSPVGQGLMGPLLPQRKVRHPARNKEAVVVINNPNRTRPGRCKELELNRVDIRSKGPIEPSGFYPVAAGERTPCNRSDRSVLKARKG